MDLGYEESMDPGNMGPTPQGLCHFWWLGGIEGLVAWDQGPQGTGDRERLISREIDSEVSWSPVFMVPWRISNLGFWATHRPGKARSVLDGAAGMPERQHAYSRLRKGLGGAGRTPEPARRARVLFLMKVRAG